MEIRERSRLTWMPDDHRTEPVVASEGESTPDELLREATKAAGRLLDALGNPLVVVVDDQVLPQADVFVAAFTDNRGRATALLPDSVAWEELGESEWRAEVKSVFETELSPNRRRELHATA